MSDHRMLMEAMTVESADIISGTSDEIIAIAQQGFFDGVRMALQLLDDPAGKDRLITMLLDAPDASPTIEEWEKQP